MRRSILLAIAVLVLLAASVAWGLRIQPDGQARVSRHGQSLTLHPSRLGWSLRRDSADCFARSVAERLLFDKRFTEPSPWGDVDARVSFTYRIPPQSAIRFHGAETWCAALDRWTRERIREQIDSLTADEIRTDPRQIGRRFASRLATSLRDAVQLPQSAVVRLELDELVERTFSNEAVAAAAATRPPLFFIGLDGADWQYLDELIAAGKMPNLARLREEGTHGTLTTMHPPLSPLLWTSMMTGVDPLEHRILDFTRFHPATGAREPITSDERERAAIWNLATFASKRVAVLGLWATYPAEPVHGTVISDRFFTFLHQDEQPLPRTTWPESLASPARQLLAASEASITAERVREFLPSVSTEELAAAETEKDPYANPVSALRRILIETDVYDRLARSEWIERKPDVMILYVQGTDSIGHMFAPFAPPRQPAVSQHDFDRYAFVPERYFQYVDRLLGEWAALARLRNGTVMIVSDHGFYWSEGRPSRISSFAAASAAKWHRQAGIYLLWGNGVAANATRGTGSILQTAPTIASLAGIALSRDFAMPPLIGQPTSAFIEYGGLYQKSPPVAVASAGGSNEEIEKLRALGYIGSSESAARPVAGGSSTRTGGSYNNEGLIHRERRNLGAARESFERAIHIDPKLASALWNLSDLLFESNELDRSDELLVAATAEGLPEGKRYLIGRAIGYQRNGKLDRATSLLEMAVDRMPDDAEIRLFRGRYRIANRNCAAALEDFRRVQQLQPGNAAAFASGGLASQCLGDEAAADAQFTRSLQLDPNQPALRAAMQ